MKHELTTGMYSRIDDVACRDQPAWKNRKVTIVRVAGALTEGSLIVILIAMCFSSHAVLAGVVIQNPGDNFLFVEAEAFDNRERNDAHTGFRIVEPGSFETEFGSLVLPETTNASGGRAVIDQCGNDCGSNQWFLDQIGYSLQFAEPGDYYVYLRYSMFEMTGQDNDSYAEEDSFFFPLAWDQDPASDELQESLDGWVFLQEFDNRPSDGRFEGEFIWNEAVFSRDDRHGNYTVTEEMVGTTLDFAIASRERGATLDAIVFALDPDLTEDDLNSIMEISALHPLVGDFDNNGILDNRDIDSLIGAIGSRGANEFDINGDSIVNETDLQAWVSDIRGTWMGDANLDGEFNSTDMVAVFQAGKYELDVQAGWADGDWTGDERFDSSDMVVAFQDGGYELGARTEVSTVPEPNGAMLVAIGAISVFRLRRRMASFSHQVQPTRVVPVIKFRVCDNCRNSTLC